jgi:hypothetical protein
MLVFDHVGLTTSEPQPDENWIEQSRCWVTNPRNHPEHIEFLRYTEGTTVPEAVRANPHVAFRVGSLEPHMEGQEILIPPFVVANFVRVVFIRKYGMVFRVHAVFERQLVRRLKCQRGCGRLQGHLCLRLEPRRNRGCHPRSTAAARCGSTP